MQQESENDTGGGTGWALRFLQIQIILWFYDMQLHKHWYEGISSWFFLNENHNRTMKGILYQYFCLLLVNKGLSKQKQTQFQVLASLCCKNQSSWKQFLLTCLFYTKFTSWPITIKSNCTKQSRSMQLLTSELGECCPHSLHLEQPRESRHPDPRLAPDQERTKGSCSCRDPSRALT